jgi:hypothetical protein
MFARAVPECAVAGRVDRGAAACAGGGGGPPSRAAARSAAASPSAGVVGRACGAPPWSVVVSSAFDRVDRADATLRTDRGMDGAADAATDGAASAPAWLGPAYRAAPAPPTAERAECTERLTDPAVRGRAAFTC